MKMRFCVIALLVVVSTVELRAQSSGAAPQNSEAIASISAGLGRIAKSVQTLNDRFKTFLDKFSTPGGSSTVNEKQQKIITGLQILASHEQRVANLQYSQIEFTKQLNDARNRYIQVESDLRPRNIDRSVALEGTTETEELRESRRQRLTAERTTLSQLILQLQSNLAETGETLRAAQQLANDMRQIYLPQIKAEMLSQ